LGKRQPRPNLSRADFGYEERSRTTAKAKKPKRADEEDEPASASQSPAKEDGARLGLLSKAAALAAQSGEAGGPEQRALDDLSLDKLQTPSAKQARTGYTSESPAKAG